MRMLIQLTFHNSQRLLLRAGRGTKKKKSELMCGPDQPCTWSQVYERQIWSQIQVQTKLICLTHVQKFLVQLKNLETQQDTAMVEEGQVISKIFIKMEMQTFWTLSSAKKKSEIRIRVNLIFSILSAHCKSVADQKRSLLGSIS